MKEIVLTKGNCLLFCTTIQMVQPKRQDIVTLEQSIKRTFFLNTTRRETVLLQKKG